MSFIFLEILLCILLVQQKSIIFLTLSSLSLFLSLPLPLPLPLPPTLESSVLLAGKCSLSILTSHLVPLMEELRERAICLWQDEHYLLASWNKQPSSASVAAAGETSSHQTEQEKLAEVNVIQNIRGSWLYMWMDTYM